MTHLAEEAPAVVWLVPLALAAHDVEEALAFPRYREQVQARVPEAARELVGSLGPRDMQVALALVTLLGALAALWAWLRWQSGRARWALLLVQGTMLLNVLSHVVVAAVVLRGYAPGLATALLLELPLSVYLLRRASRERWLSRRQLQSLAPAAVVVHGPLLAGFLLWVARL